MTTFSKLAMTGKGSQAICLSSYQYYHQDSGWLFLLWEDPEHRYQDFLEGSKYCRTPLINCYKLFNIRIKDTLWNFKDSCVPLSSQGYQSKPRVFYVLVNTVQFLLLQPLQSFRVFSTYLYWLDQQPRERQVLSMTQGSQISLGLAAMNLRAIASHPVCTSLTEADPYPTPHLGIVCCSQPACWLDDRQKRRKRTNPLIYCGLKYFTPKQEAAEQTDIQAGRRMFFPWEVQWLLSLLTDPVSETPISLFAPEQCNCLSVPKECSEPMAALLYLTQLSLPCLCAAFLTVKGQSSFPGWKNLNPVWTGLGLLYSTTAVLIIWGMKIALLIIVTSIAQEKLHDRPPVYSFTFSSMFCLKLSNF